MLDDDYSQTPTRHEGSEQLPVSTSSIPNYPENHANVGGTVVLTELAPAQAPARRIPSVLIVDDNPGDVELLRIAFEMCDCVALIETVGDGHAAVQRLTMGAIMGTLPDLVLLDLNMPRANGLEVLGSIRLDRRLERVPVVMLTTSGQAVDRRRCLELGAREFHTKPEHIRDLVGLVQSLQHYLDSGADSHR